MFKTVTTKINYRIKINIMSSNESLVFQESIPLSLYIHIPWCIKKCPYCDFNSHTYTDELPEEKYIDCLLEDLTNELPRVWGRRLISIFIGGGTPSLFSAKAIERLLEGINILLPFHKDLEITMEANPGTFEQTKFSNFYSAGINRLSLGIQSFSKEKLKALGRVHDDKEALNAIKIARKAGFTNFNLDIMYALPEQTLNEAILDISKAIEQEPNHISWYQLSLEPNTAFYHKPPNIPTNDVAWQIQEQGQALLAEHNYKQYEISAYATDNKQSTHNNNYWHFGDYLGIGAGAHGKITNVSNNTIERTTKYRSPKDYLNKRNNDYTSSNKIISKQELPFEFMLNALRLTDGFNLKLYEQRTGLPFADIQSIMESAKKRDLIDIDNARMRTTKLGRRFTDDLIMMFMGKNHVSSQIPNKGV